MLRYTESRGKRITGGVLLLCSVVLLLLNFIGFSGLSFLSFGRTGISPAMMLLASFALLATGGIGILVGLLYIAMFMSCVVLPIIAGIKALNNKKYFSVKLTCILGIVFGVLWLIAAIIGMAMGSGVTNYLSFATGGTNTALLLGVPTVAPTLWLLLYLSFMIAALVLLRPHKVNLQPSIQPQESTDTVESGSTTLPGTSSNYQAITIQINYSDDSGFHVVERKISTHSPLTIGRADNCRLVLVDDRVSRSHGPHAILTYNDLDGLVIEDNMSKNGVQVNGETIMGKRKISAKDTVRMGNSKLSFKIVARMDNTDLGITEYAANRNFKPVAVKLTYRDDYGNHEVAIAIRDSVTIGRDRKSAVFIASQTVSDPHAKLINIGAGQLQIEDLGSRNGVVINGTKIAAPTDLPSGTTVTLGDVRVRVTITD